MKKIIFLDIDGVICIEFNQRQEYNLGKDKLLFEYYVFNPLCIGWLNRIVRETNAEIVISSSWRKTFTLEEIKDLFEQNDFLYPEKIIDYTCVGYTKVIKGEHVPFPRGLEIKIWEDLNLRKTPTGFNNENYKYIILDDDTDMLFEQRHFFINTVFEQGLTEKEYFQAIKILN